MAERLDIVISGPDPNTSPTECPTCGFDSVSAFRFLCLTEDGVSRGPTWTRCLRCVDEAAPA